MIECFRDENGFSRVNPNDVHPLVATFLEQDVQASTPTCDEFLGLLDEIENGRRGDWSGTGNAHHVAITKDLVTITNAWDDSLGVALIPMPLFRECVAAWRSHISTVATATS